MYGETLWGIGVTDRVDENPRAGGSPATGYVVVASEADPVASALAARWGTPPSTGWHVDGAVVRRFPHGPWYLRRPGHHIHDELLDVRFPKELREARVTLVFPSVHRSGQNVRSLTVHPLGNPGPTSEVGGRPRTLVPTDPPLMTRALRALEEDGGALGSEVTFEATHHGPELTSPAFFVEIGYAEQSEPPAEELALLARTIPRLDPEPDEKVALGVGGGHYVPHFTDLALKRRWAFGHLLSRHALPGMDRATALAALKGTPGAQGILFARAADQEIGAVRDLAPRLRDTEAAARKQNG